MKSAVWEKLTGDVTTMRTLRDLGHGDKIIRIICDDEQSWLCLSGPYGTLIKAEATTPQLRALRNMIDDTLKELEE